MTETTLVIARILGAYMLIMGVAVLIHRNTIREMMERLEKDFPLTFIMGVMALILGLVIVSLHNVWAGPVSVAISLIGWLALLKGAGIVLLRQRYIDLFRPLAQSARAGLLWGAIVALVGLWLLSAGLGM